MIILEQNIFYIFSLFFKKYIFFILANKSIVKFLHQKHKKCLFLDTLNANISNNNDSRAQKNFVVKEVTFKLVVSGIKIILLAFCLNKYVQEKISQNSSNFVKKLSTESHISEQTMQKGHERGP